MTTRERCESAIRYRKNGANCAQSLLAGTAESVLEQLNALHAQWGIDEFIIDTPVADELLDELIEQMKRSDAKINAVADLLYDKYLGTFLPLLPPNTDPKDFKQVFITMFRATTGLQEKLAGEVRDLAGGYLTDLKIEDVTYDLGRIDLGSDVVDMLADNLDPKGTANPRNTLDIYGEIISALPVSLQFSPRFYPTEVEFDIRVEPNVKTKIGETRLHENDLRQIIDGTEIILPVKLEKYFPGSGFTPDQKIVIALRLVKRGGLKLNL